MAEVELTIADRHYRVACRDGEEDALRRASELVDAKSREAIAGLGTLSETRQLLFASLLLADQIVEKAGQGSNGGTAAATAPIDDAAVRRIEQLANRLDSLAQALEKDGPRP